MSWTSIDGIRITERRAFLDEFNREDRRTIHRAMRTGKPIPSRLLIRLLRLVDQQLDEDIADLTTTLENYTPQEPHG